MSIENKVPMSYFTEVTEIADTARIIGLQDDENIKIPLQSFIAKTLSRVDEDILTIQDINVENGVTGFEPIGQVAEGDKRAVSGKNIDAAIVSPLEVAGISIKDENYNIKSNNLSDYLEDTVLLANGKTSSNSGWRTLNEKIRVPRGKYRANIILTASVYFIILDKEDNIITLISDKSSNAYEFDVPKDAYIRFCVRNTQFDTAFINKVGGGYVILNDSNSEGITEEKVNQLIDLKTPSILKESYLNKSLLLQPFKNDFDYSIIRDIKVIRGNKSLLKDFDLYIPYIRIKGIGSATNTIVQLCKKEGDNVGVNNVVFSSYLGDSVPDSNGFLRVVLLGGNNSIFDFEILIDCNILLENNLSGIDLKSTIRLNTAYLAYTFIENLIKDYLLLFLGDSQIEFKNIPEQVGNILEIDSKNAGVGGTRMSLHTSANYAPLSFCELSDAISTGDFTNQNTALDALIDEATNPKKVRLRRTKESLNTTDFSKVNTMPLWYGTNDWSSSIPIGDKDLTNKSKDNLLGAMNYGIEKLKTKYPNMKLVFLTPLHRIDKDTGESSTTFKNTLGLTLVDYVNAIKENAYLNNCDVIDCYNTSNLGQYNHTEFFEDSTHLSPKGATYMSEFLSKRLEKNVF